MGCLAWLLAIAGVAGASLAFAVSAPEQAWWVLGLIVAALLAGPHVVQWWLSRAGRTERLAARWWDAGPGPAEVAFLCGGPDRVVDLVLTDLVADRRVTLGDDGRLTLPATGDNDNPAPDGTDDDKSVPAGADDGDFRRQIVNRLGYGPADVPTLRFSVRSVTATPALWRRAVRQRLVLPAWRREYTHWYLAGALVAIGYAVAVAIGGFRPEDGPTFLAAVGAIGLGGIALWRPRFLVGYEFDPRTAAGLRAAEVAFLADRPDDRRHRIAVQGIRSANDLGARGPNPVRVPPSQWHVPWYARRVREGSAPWWHEVAQSTTDYAETLGDPGGAHDSDPGPG
ncbi:hypothetical protein ODJ79_11165 [Actinoplanes sp. KI2]|uniref:hypothetical protein n=1 Tax=Actinoplanes sp. KI2 TaxID=2983315 RepID=UPI0021D5ACEB|nr:hypothetical protein [Actinoplanes sp. KI2]MCU7724275.1 hypothetical protein [Actinoplanes sp. KI2]